MLFTLLFIVGSVFAYKVGDCKVLTGKEKAVCKQEVKHKLNKIDRKQKREERKLKKADKRLKRANRRLRANKHKFNNAQKKQYRKAKRIRAHKRARILNNHKN